MKSKRMRRKHYQTCFAIYPRTAGGDYFSCVPFNLFMPSDPVSVRMSAEAVFPSVLNHGVHAQIHGLDRPLLVRYGDWLWNILHGNMGKSYITDADVLIRFCALPYTLKNGGRFSFADPCISIPVGYSRRPCRTASLIMWSVSWRLWEMLFLTLSSPFCLHVYFFPHRLRWIPCWRRQSL